MSAVLVAAALDLALGEPPARVHPVAWMGRYLDRTGRRLPAAPPRRAVLAGGLALGVGAAATAAAGAVAGSAAARLPAPLRPLLGGTVLWTIGSGRVLLTEVAGVERALARSLPAGRERLAGIVSRDPRLLSEAEVRAAALESLAENLSDSVVAPLFWYAVGGLPAAAAYRLVNTADAMWGYRTPRWEHAGKAAARADDLLNLAPARLTAVLLARGPARWRSRLPREARRTPSPNGGWPMAALALALDVRLAKPGHYTLNEAARDPGPADTTAALRLAARAAATAVLLAAAAERLRPRPATPTEGAP